jgi:hypothetical protein
LADGEAKPDVEKNLVEAATEQSKAPGART